MKRRREGDASANTSVAASANTGVAPDLFNGTLPEEIKQYIFTLIQHKVPQLSGVCTRWYWSIQNYDGWLEVAMTRYAKLYRTLKCKMDSGETTIGVVPPPWEGGSYDKSIDDWLTIFVLATESTNPRLRSHIGLLMNTKFHRHYTHIIEGTRPQATRSIANFLKTYAGNELTHRNFHKRDFYLNFRETSIKRPHKTHYYKLVIRGDKHKRRVMYWLAETTRDHDDESGDNNIDEEDVIETALTFISRVFVGEYASLRSVTTFIHGLFPVFDADRVIARMRSDPIKWARNKYFDMSPKEIKDFWKEHNDKASELGHIMHNNLEMYYTGRPYDDTTPEFALFKRFEAAHITGKLRPYRAEWALYSHEWQFCGAADIFYEYIDDETTVHRDTIITPQEKKKHLVLMDWKRSKEIRKHNPFREDTKGIASCTEDLDNCNFIQYGIQQCLYKMLLEKEYDHFVIDTMFLVILHPNQEDYIMEEIVWSDFEPYMQQIIAYRTELLATEKSLEQSIVSLKRKSEDASSSSTVQKRPKLQ